MIKVLLVDDEKLALEYLEHIIDWEYHGFELIGVTTNPEQALAIYKTHRPDLVISDVKMPGLNGLELGDAIREYGGNTHILFLSAYKNFDYVKQAIRLGIDDYILKSDLEEDGFLRKILKLKEEIIKEKAKKQYTITAIYKNLLNQISVSGSEENGQRVLREYMEQYADEIRTDEIGDVICVLNPESPVRIMLSAHADEIGLVVTRITEEGRIQAIERGGIMTHNYPGQKVQICTKKGIVYGVVECSRELLKKETVKVADLLIDIGAVSKEDALQHVSLGDTVVLDSGIRKLLHNRITARAMDDRIGVFVIMEAFKRAREKGCSAGVYAAATVGEETTKNGAFWCSAQIDPALAVVVDVTNCTDYSRFPNAAVSGDIVLGNGPALCNSPIATKQLNEKMVECAQRAGIGIQREAASSRSFTDADQIHFSNKGVPVVFTGIPLRNMHNPGEVADMKDVEGCIELIAEFLCSFK